MVISLLSWNPKSANNDDRVREILDYAHSQHRADILTLQGTCRRNDDAQRAVRVHQHEKYVEYVWGWQRGKFSNKSAGVSIFVGRRWQGAVRRTFPAPQRLAGRVGALRLRDAAGDYLVVSVYCPPRVEQCETYQAALREIFKWVEELLQECGRRTTPIWATDLNDQLGLVCTAGGEWQHDEDAVVGPHAHGRQHEAGALLRTIAAPSGLTALTTRYDLGPTYHGWQGRASCIDHVLVPQAALPLVLQFVKEVRMQRRLQLLPDVRLRDHSPLLLRMSAKFDAPRVDRGLMLDRDRIMLMLRKGVGRQEYIQQVEHMIGQTDMHSWKELAAEHTADKIYGKLVHCMRTAAEEVFPKHKRGPDLAALPEDRMQLLAERRAIRDRLERGSTTDAEEAEAQLLLLKVRLKTIGDRGARARRRHWRARQRALLGEISEAWQGRRFYDVHQLRCRYAANGRFPKKRIFGVPPVLRPAADEWREYLGQPAHAGGMLAQQVEFGEQIEEHLQARRLEDDQQLQYDAGVQHLVQEDWDGIVRFLKGTPKRKSYPGWALPAELCLALLRPRANLDMKGQGIGSELLRTLPTFFWWVFEQVLKTVRCTGWAPLAWSHAQAYGIDKGKVQDGPKAVRLVQGFDVIGMAWHSSLQQRMRSPMFPCWAHGSVRGRSRQEAMTVQ